jgi:hypothetical protein
MGQLEAEKTNPAPAFKWQTLAPADGISSPTATVQLGTDNRLMIYYLNGQGQLGSFLIQGSASSPKFLQQAALALPTASTGSPSVSFAIGDASQWPDPNTNLKGIKVPVYRHIFYTDKQQSISPGMYGVQPAARISQYAWALRDVLPALPAVQQTLVGIIEGPPPIPGENIAVTGPGNLDTIGFTRYGVQKGSSSGSYVSLKTGLLFRMTSEGGQAGGIDSEIDIKREKEDALASSSSTISLAVFNATAKTVMDQTINKDVVIGSGQAFLLGSIYTGYQYHFLDVNEKPIPGAREYTQVFATKPQIKAYPFDLLGAGPYPIPGKLMSYVVTTEEYKTLQNSQSALLGFKPDPNSSPGFGIYYSWNKGGSYAEQASALESTTESSTTTFDLSAMLGFGLHGDIQSWSMMGGGSLSTTVETSISKDLETSISTEVNFPATTQSGVYESYAYHTVPFKGSAASATELVDYLTRNPSASNTNLLKALVIDPLKPLPPLGEPWKISHFIEAGDYFPWDLNQPQQMTSSMSSNAFIPPSVPPALAELGVSTPNDAGMLHMAVRDLKAPKRVGAGTSAPDVISPELRDLAKRLSPEQLKQLEDYATAVHTAKMSEFRKVHPQWTPRKLDTAHPVQTNRHATEQMTGRPQPKQVDFPALSQRGDRLTAVPYTPAKAPNP